MAIFLTIWWFIKRVFWFVTDNWKVVLPAVLVLVAVVFVFRACNKPPKPMTPAQVQKAQKAIADADRQAMEQVFTEAAADEAVADRTAADAEATKTFEIEAARQRVERMTNAELADYLNQRAK